MRRPALEVVEGGAARPREPRALLHDLYTRYGGAVHARCRYLLRDDARAQDALHDVFARALTEDLGAHASPLAWLMTVATRHCLNQLRGERAAWRRWFERDARANAEAGHGGEGPLETRELVRKLLARVDEETQAAVVHYHVDGMTLEEVAAALGRSVPTVRKRLESFARLGGEALEPRR